MTTTSPSSHVIEMPAPAVRKRSAAKPRLGKGLSAMICTPAPSPATESRDAREVRAQDAQPARARTIGLVAQVRMACAWRNLLAMACGMAMGGVVPVCAWWLAHHEAPAQPWLWALVVGALLFSATTLWEFGNLAFHSRVKAVGFAVLLEGVMICSSTPWLTYTALGYLVLINAIATGARLALEDNS